MKLGFEWKLYIGTRFTGVTVVPDDRWPEMWRVRHEGRLSDIVNLTRAKDAALSWARADGIQINIDHTPSWKTARGGYRASRIEQNEGAATPVAGELCGKS